MFQSQSNDFQLSDHLKYALASLAVKDSAESYKTKFIQACLFVSFYLITISFPLPLYSHSALDTVELENHNSLTLFGIKVPYECYGHLLFVFYRREIYLEIYPHVIINNYL